MIKYVTILYLCIILIHFQSCNTSTDDNSISGTVISDSLPSVLPDNHADLIEGRLRLEAKLKFAEYKLPENLSEWGVFSSELRNTIIEKAGVIADANLPLNIKETGVIKMKGYIVKNITFQTRPGVFATANLYIPDGKGPYPAVINMLGHWTKGKIDPTGPQAVGHSLAVNGYVCLTIDPWGAGERSTIHGKFEYHGSNLGASFMNIGESLVGIQISDNMRGVDLLCSLSNVDSDNIGATGASGGGNQTMWLAAVDERIKAAVPVVSVGSFESYIMRSNCICELLIDGLTFTEEAGVLALANAIMPINHTKDSNPTFFPEEMLRSYKNARHVFQMRGEEDNISYRLFDLPHGYMAEDREAMLGWFDMHLKGLGSGTAKKEIPFKQLPEEQLLVFPIGQRDTNVVSTEEYCKLIGNELRTVFLNSKSFSVDQKKLELRNILRLDENFTLKNAHHHSSIDGWDRIVLETSDNRLIPLLHISPINPSQGYTILCSTEGKNHVSSLIIDDLAERGSGIVIVDLSGTGEVTSTLAKDGTSKLHTQSRAELWLGKTILGEWVKELNVLTQFLISDYNAEKVCIDGSKEAGLAGLFLCVVEGSVENVILRDAPVSYLFDNRENVDYFSMAVHLPGFLNWGDVSLVAALSGKNIAFINPVSMSGSKLSSDELKEYQSEYDNVRQICKQKGKTLLN
jgi:Acetyl xylan esterase (AXE1)